MTGQVGVTQAHQESLARRRSRVAGIAFLLLALWLLFVGLISSSFGNAWPIYGPWLGGISAITAALFVARWLWGVLLLSTIVGLFSAAFWGLVVVVYGQLLFAFGLVLSLIGALSALRAWLSFRSAP